MELEKIKRVAVINAGPIGSQIAQLFSQVGKYSVVMMDFDSELVNNGIEAIKAGLKRYYVDKGKMEQNEMDEIVNRIRGVTDIAEAVKNADFVVEAAEENLNVKRDIFKALDKSAPPDIILASNTIFLNITAIANVTKRPDKVVGMHFFEPTNIMRLVEVNTAATTSEETIAVTVALAKKLGKEPVVCKGFSFGHLANRAYFGMLDEAIQMVWERIASPEDIDKTLKLGYNLPMGPLEVGDFAGFWGMLALSEQDRIREQGPEKGHLHPLVRMMVEAGYPGGRGQKGIYDFYREVLGK